MNCKFIVLLILVLIFSIPFASAEEIETKDDGGFVVVTEHLYAERGEGAYKLNLSNSQEVYNASPSKQLWDKNITGGGKIVDGLLPFDIINISDNATEKNITVEGSVRFNKTDIATGFSFFILRLPVSFNPAPTSQLEIKITNRGDVIADRFNKVIFSDYYANGNYTLFNKTNTLLVNKTYHYFGHRFNVWYVAMNAYIFPEERYNISINLYNISNVKVFVYPYDFLGDGLNQTHLIVEQQLNTHLSYDVGWGFEIKQFIFNTISTLELEKYDELRFTISNPPTGVYNISYLLPVYITNNTNTSILLEFWSNNAEALKKYTFNSSGFQIIKDKVQLNISGELTESIRTDNKSVYVFILPSAEKNIIFKHEDYYPYGTPYLNYVITYNIKAALYQDIVIRKEGYYIGGSIELPGSVIQTWDLILKYAPNVDLGLELKADSGAVIIALLHLSEDITTFICDELGPFEWVKFLLPLAPNALKQLLSALVNFVINTNIQFKLSKFAYLSMKFLSVSTDIVSLLIYVLGVWVVKRFRDGMVILPLKGYNAMLEEWEGVLNFIASIAKKISGVVKR